MSTPHDKLTARVNALERENMYLKKTIVQLRADADTAPMPLPMIVTLQPQSMSWFTWARVLACMSIDEDEL